MRYNARGVLFVIALILLSAFALSAQQEPDSHSQVAHDLNEAHRLMTERRLDDATAAYRAVIDAAHRTCWRITPSITPLLALSCSTRPASVASMRAPARRCWSPIP
jgi:hypothetical protein